MLKKKFLSLLVIPVCLLSMNSVRAEDTGEGSPDGDPNGPLMVPVPTVDGKPAEQGPSQTPRANSCPPVKPGQPLPAPCTASKPSVPAQLPAQVPQLPPAQQPIQVQMSPGEFAVHVCYDPRVTHCSVTDGQRIGWIRGVDSLQRPTWADVKWEGSPDEENVDVHSLYPEVDFSFLELNRLYPQLDPRNIPALRGIVRGNAMIDEVSLRAPDDVYRAGQIYRVFYDGTVEFSSAIHNPSFYRFRDYAITHVSYIGRRVSHIYSEHSKRVIWREGQIVQFRGDTGNGQTRIVKLFANNTALVVREFGHSANTESVLSLDDAVSSVRMR